MFILNILKYVKRLKDFLTCKVILSKFIAVFSTQEMLLLNQKTKIPKMELS